MKRQYRVPIAAMAVVALAAALALIAPWGQGVLAQGDIIYVDADATGVPDGSSWGTAFTTLQPALEAADTDDEIWVAEGTYTPSAEHGGTGERYKSFQMENGVEIYGGFDPSVGASAWGDRDWEAHPTFLSGDIGSEGDASDNSYHVFYHPDGTALDGTAILDGFTITGGNADGSGDHENGGGMFNYGSSPALTDVVFSSNSASNRGGGMCNDRYSSPTLSNCTFEGNSAAYGGGMYNYYYSSPMLTGCTFSGNSALHNGGGMNNMMYSSPALDNCTFSGNSASSDGGGMYNSTSSPALTDCDFEANQVGSSMLSGYGAGMYNTSSSPTLIDCDFKDNYTDSMGDGGGMYNNASSPTLTGCTFDGNSAYSGAGMVNRNGSSGVLTNCTFEHNLAGEPGSGGGMYNNDSSPTLVNCTFASNSAGEGGGMANSNGSSAVLTNCTFEDNSADWEGGGLRNSSSSPTLTNCIFWGNAPGQITSDGTSSPVVTYCDVEGGYPGETNIDQDPLFVDAGSGDYHLGPGSPCIDAGDNGAPNIPPYDFEGDDRVLDGNGDGTATVDMGVDEAQEQVPPPDVIYVDQDAEGGNDGTSWDDAFTTLQPALSWAVDGVEIWVAEGTYTPTAEHGGSGDRYRSFQMANGVEIYGGFDPSVGATGWAQRDWEAHPAILSGDLDGDDEPGFVNNGENSYHVFYHPEGTDLDSTAILDGFTISGGNANDLSDHYMGGGIYNDESSPALSNCTFSGNAATYGGGMFNMHSAPTLANCTFEGNGGAGGGVHNAYSSPTLINCTFWGNSGPYGGGMANYYSSSPTLTNCTFAGNAVSNWGGALYNYDGSAPTLTNCILWGDTPEEIYNREDGIPSAPFVTYSNVQGGHLGEGNLDVNPWFADAAHGDFHLGPCSLCIDAGNDSAPYLPDYDFEGDDRILDGNGDAIAAVDMGVDEVAVPGTCSHVYLPLVLRVY